MQKQTWKGLLILLLTGMVWACQKSDRLKNPLPNGNFNTEMVKEWYYSEFKGSAVWNASPQKGKKLPDWSHPRSFRVGNSEVVEYPLSEERSAYPVAGAGPAEAARIAEASLSRIAFIKGPDGQITVRESRLVPEPGYLQQKQYDISNQYPAAVEGDFTGRIYVTDWDGRPVSAARLRNGKITGWGHKASAPANRTETEGCTYEQYCVWEQQCVMQFYGDGMIVMECGPWINTGDCWTEEVCNGPGDPCLMYGIGCEGDGGGEPVPEIINNVDDPCIRQSVNNAINGGCSNKISNFINSVFANSEQFHIQFNDSPILLNHPDDVAYTTWTPMNPDESKANITFSNTLLNSSSKEYIAATILHEVVHAWIDYKFPNAGENIQQHEMMAQPGRFNMMRDALMELCPNLSLSEATDLTWGGLYSTIAFISLPQTEKDRIVQRNVDFQNGNLGTPC